VKTPAVHMKLKSVFGTTQTPEMISVRMRVKERNLDSKGIGRVDSDTLKGEQ
jgi:hypothetical protein